MLDATSRGRRGLTTTCKIMLLGEMGVGKTSIAKQLVFGTFAGEYGSTIGVDIYTYKVEPPPEGQPFTFLVWDTDGSFGDSAFEMVYMRQAQAALVVADIGRPSTVASAVRLCDRFADVRPGRFLAAILNKWDLVEPGIEPDIPDALADPGFPVLRTSAKTGMNVKQTFHDAAHTILRRGMA